AEDTFGASEDHPVELERGTPATVARPFSYVDTGNPLPTWANAVIMIERVYAGRASDASSPAALADGGARLVYVRSAAAPWQHVRMVGEDIVASEPILARGHRIQPHDIGALLAAGVGEIAVRPRPVVAILPTGNELIEPGDALLPGR